MHELKTPLSAQEAEFITSQLPAQRHVRDGRTYLSFATPALLLRAQVLASELRCPPQRSGPAALRSKG